MPSYTVIKHPEAQKTACIRHTFLRATLIFLQNWSATGLLNKTYTLFAKLAGLWLAARATVLILFLDPNPPIISYAYLSGLTVASAFIIRSQAHRADASSP